MRIASLIALLLIATSLSASDQPARSWEPEWDMHLREGTCWLTRGHLNHRAPPSGGLLYDDFRLRVHVPILWRDRPPYIPREQIGVPRLHIYTARPRFDVNGEALRIDGAVLQGRRLNPQTEEAAKNLHPDYRFLLMSLEDSSAVLAEMVAASRGTHLDLQLSLSDQQQVTLKVPIGQFFKTWRKMLDVCMNPDAVH
jgi:hypothetical protein